MSINAHLHWKEGLYFTADAGSGATVITDGKAGGEGASPMELVLIGAAGCTAVDVVAILEKKRIQLTGLEVRVSGERAYDHPRRFTKIRIDYVIRGAEISQKAVEQAITLSETKYCSAMASLNAEFEHTVQIIDGEQP
jgi:putative redox protein